MLPTTAFIFAIAIYANLQLTSSRKLPSFFEKCKLGDTKLLDECFSRNIAIIKPYLLKGIPEMRIPSVEPLNIPLVELSLNNFNASYKNVNIYNASIFEAYNLKSELEVNKLHIEIHFPFLRIEANYETNGKILLLELHGSGKSQTNITDVRGIVDLQGKRYEKNGKTYIDFNNNKLSLKIGTIQSYFGNLFVDNEELTEATNKIFNDNSKEFLEELRPVIEETVSAFVFGIIKNVYTTFALEELFIS